MAKLPVDNAVNPSHFWVTLNELDDVVVVPSAAVNLTARDNGVARPVYKAAAVVTMFLLSSQIANVELPTDTAMVSAMRSVAVQLASFDAQVKKKFLKS